MNILDLGCGTAKKPGAIGVDRIPLKDVDVIANLDEYPYPFADNMFDRVYLNDVIEHLPNTITTMEEIYRITRPNAQIFIRVVNWNSHYTAMDPTHVKAFTENSFDFFGKRKGRNYYTTARFDVVKVDYQYNDRAIKYFRNNQRIMKFLSFYLNNILEGLNFELRTIKKSTDSKVSKVNSKNLHQFLRCPICISNSRFKESGHSGKLKRYSNSWLLCESEGCKRKYPVYKGLPVITKEGGGIWRSTPLSKLPDIPPGKFSRISGLD